MKKEVYIILHDVRSTHNVGSIFRTADTAGISKIFLTGYTPAPTDKFGRARKDIAKVALGAEKNIPWEFNKEILALLKKLKKEGVFVVSVEQANGSVDYKKVKIRYPAVFIYGNEVTGLPRPVLKASDVVAEIPMKGEKESLNVSVSVGVSLFRMLGI